MLQGPGHTIVPIYHNIHYANYKVYQLAGCGVAH